jgi:hypothetical protein
MNELNIIIYIKATLNYLDDKAVHARERSLANDWYDEL